MFTGIVQGVCSVVVAEVGDTTRLHIDLGDLADGLHPGASVAVNGVCLTAVSIDDGVVGFDVIAQTRNATNLRWLERGSAVNIERSFRVGDEVGGHILSGHVAATVAVCEATTAAGNTVVTATVPSPWMRYLMTKGFVALNGASLTIQELDREAGTMSVALIPETLARTTFGRIAVGDQLNLEVDAQTQTVVETVTAVLPTLVPDLLRQQRNADGA